MLDFHNHVKRTLYRRLIKKNSTILELAGGRGGDLWKLRDCGVSEVRIALSYISQLETHTLANTTGFAGGYG